MPPRRINDDSDSDDFISDDDARRKGGKKAKVKDKSKEPAYAWEATYTRSWDQVQEDARGSLQGAVEDLLARGRRRLLLAPEGAIRRTIIRHLVLVLDLSAAMLDRDMRPTRFDLTLQYAREFVSEWFDQNPLGQIALVGMRGGLGERLGAMSGSPPDVLRALAERHKLEPAGAPSLQNALEMARHAMGHLPAHASREVLVLTGALSTVDPGNIADTLDACVADKIRISVLALAAEMKVCREMATRTGGTFGVALNEGHYKDLLFALIPPPAQRALARAASAPADLLLMGFPARAPGAALCACHAEIRGAGFVCPRCRARVCDVPTDCDVCGLMLVSAPHLARSYHHLFPVHSYAAVMEVAPGAEAACHACSRPFRDAAPGTPPPQEGLSAHGRYACPACAHDFCAECDVFVHDVLHCCPGCGK